MLHFEQHDRTDDEMNCCATIQIADGIKMDGKKQANGPA